MTMVFRNTWKLSSKELEIRPALGHVGDKFTAPVQKNPKLLKEYPPDNFISGLKEKTIFFTMIKVVILLPIQQLKT